MNDLNDLAAEACPMCRKILPQQFVIAMAIQVFAAALLVPKKPAKCVCVGADCVLCKAEIRFLAYDIVVIDGKAAGELRIISPAEFEKIQEDNKDNGWFMPGHEASNGTAPPSMN